MNIQNRLKHLEEMADKQGEIGWGGMQKEWITIDPVTGDLPGPPPDAHPRYHRTFAIVRAMLLSVPFVPVRE